MLRNTRIAGQPLHPRLITLPIALFAVTIAFELWYLGTRDPFYYRAAMVTNAVGVVLALAALVPRVIAALARRSWSLAAPRPHAIFELLTTTLFATSSVLLVLGWTRRVMIDGEYAIDATIPLAIDVVGLVSMVFSGMLAYALVQTCPSAITPAYVTAAAPALEPLLDERDDYAFHLYGAPTPPGSSR